MMSLKTLSATGLALLALAGCERVELPPQPAVNLDGYPTAIHRQLAQALGRVDSRPRKAAANGRAGMLLHTYDQLLGADVYYQRAALLDPDEFRWPYLRSWVLAGLGRTDEAMQLLQTALEIEPGYSRARVRLAELQLSSGQLEQCAATLRTLIAEQSDRPEAYFLRAQLRLRMNDANAAIEDLGRTLALTGHFGGLHHAYAQAYRLAGDEAATRHHTRLAEQFADARADIPDPVMSEVLLANISTTARIERAQAYASRGDVARAETLLVEALEDDPDSLPLHVTLAGLYGGRGDFANADRHLAHAATIDPDHPRLHYSTGVARLGEQRFAEAAEAFERSLELDANNADAWAQLGLVRQIQGNQGQALEHFRTALEHDPWHRQSHWLLGRALNQAGDHETAVAHLALLRPIRDPTAPAILLDLGRAYHGSGDRDTAIAVLGEALAAAGEFGDSQSRAGANALLRRLERESSP